jgi:hypothetical protein
MSLFSEYFYDRVESVAQQEHVPGVQVSAEHACC